jgi:F1F0 ATPase subunit 2
MSMLPFAYVAGGIVLGLIYFRTLWWTSRRFALGGRAPSTVIVTLARFMLLAGLLALASREGAMPLLMLALGVFVGRFGVMRNIREATS